MEIHGLSKNYGSFRALDNVSFELNEGEIFGYIGPNGAGKTTTMKILVGLITASQGEVRIGGYKMPEHKRDVHKLLGYLPQNVAFQEWRTVNHALKTFGKLSGLEESQLERRIIEVLADLALSDVRHKKISQLSGGMVQKVGLAQALLHNPKFLVLDEPLGGLDPSTRYQFKEIISRLAKNGSTILFSSHILSDVQDVATRIGILNRGRIKKTGTLNELKLQLTEQKAVEIDFSPGNQQFPDLTKIAGVKSVTTSSADRVIVYFDALADVNYSIDNIILGIIKSGNHIRSVMPLSPTLDEIYTKYVAEGENA